MLEQLVRTVRGLSAGVGDLSLPAAATLARLVREGPRRLSELAADEGVSQPGMTQLVTRLERDGLLRRTPSPDDGRVVLVEVTAAGAELVARRREARTAAVHDLLDRLDPGDRADVERAVPALRRLTDLVLSPGAPR